MSVMSLRSLRRAVVASAVSVLLVAGFGVSLEAQAEPLFCRKPKAEVERLDEELARVQLELGQVRDELRERDRRIESLSEQLLQEQARVRGLRSEIAMLRGEDMEIAECLAFSRAEMKFAPVGTRCRYGDQANAVAEKVASKRTAQAWRDSSGMIWDLAQGSAKTHWITAVEACEDQGAKLPQMGDFRRAEASGFLRSVINPVRGYDEVHTRYQYYTATLKSPVRFDYRISAGVWGDFSFICVW